MKEIFGNLQQLKYEITYKLDVYSHSNTNISKYKKHLNYLQSKKHSKTPPSASFQQNNIYILKRGILSYCRNFFIATINHKATWLSLWIPCLQPGQRLSNCICCFILYHKRPRNLEIDICFDCNKQQWYNILCCFAYCI